MPKASLKVNVKNKRWWVYFPLYGGTGGREFTDEWKAYRFAANNRPASVVLKASGVPAGEVAYFPLEPSWHSGV